MIINYQLSTIAYLTPPAHGHVNPTLPVIQELVRRGHTVTCFNNDEFRPVLEKTGATFRPYPPTAMTSSEFSRLLQDSNLARVTALLLRVTGALMPFMLDELQRIKPDLVIFDSLALWGKMASTQLNLPTAGSITHFIMDTQQLGVRDLVSMFAMVLPTLPSILQARSNLTRHYPASFPQGSPLFPMRGDINLVFTSRDLHPPTKIIDDTFKFVGPSINPDTRAPDPAFTNLGAEKIIYISLGTVHQSNVEFFHSCFAAFADYPAKFILSIGKETNINSLGTPPKNFIVRPSVPQLQILEQSTAFITHAGMNSLQESLYYGVPMLLLPLQHEQLLNARVAAARDAGILLRSDFQSSRVTPTDLTRALDTLHSDPKYRASAQSLQKSLRATGGYFQAADDIESYLNADKRQN